jgi:peptidyl-prolyl cis-trans isomerase C
MRLIVASALFFSACALAQPAKDPPVAIVNGKQITGAEVDAFVAALPQTLQTNFHRDPKEFMRQYAMMQLFSQQATERKLDEQSPYKERLAYARMQILVQCMMDDANKHFTILPDDQRKMYEERKARYTQASLKAIYIAFSSGLVKPDDEKAKKLPTEAAAKTKAEALYKQLQAGADFAKLVKENSDDPTSAAKDGDFGTIKQSDGIPEEIKSTIFALKQGEVSKPVRQPNGFYIFKVSSLEVEPYEKVKDDLFKDLQQESFQKWFEKMRGETKVEFEDESYFKSAQTSSTTPAAAQK